MKKDHGPDTEYSRGLGPRVIPSDEIMLLNVVFFHRPLAEAFGVGLPATVEANDADMSSSDRT